jgi:Fe-S-cluster containining protein
MNSSAWVDPADCRTCGECCTYFEIAYPKHGTKNHLSEIDRLKALVGVGDLITTREEGGIIWLRINAPCRHIVDRSGYPACGIYDSPERPLMCAQFPYRESPPHHCPHKRTTARRPQ